ncbi:MAG: hypothetical protein ACFFD4_16385 [Candidatus Odinarchaeota archaeon]
MKMDKIAKSLALLAVIFVLTSLNVYINGNFAVNSTNIAENPLIAENTAADRDTRASPFVNRHFLDHNNRQEIINQLLSSSSYENSEHSTSARSVSVMSKISASSTNQGQLMTLLTDLEYPKGLWIKGDKVYFTETAGRNTVYGGTVALNVFDLSTGQENLLVDNPVASDAVVVASDGMIYLTSYVRVIPGKAE